jgi:hypothetical protein
LPNKRLCWGVGGANKRCSIKLSRDIKASTSCSSIIKLSAQILFQHHHGLTPAFTLFAQPVVEWFQSCVVFFVTFCNIFYVRGCMYLLRKLVPSWFRSSLATFFLPKSLFFFTRVFPERRVRRGHFVNVLKSKKISFLEKTHRHCQSIN